MANWASTSYRIEGNESDLQEMFNLCKAFVNDERPVMEENASKEWEGNIVLALGIDKGSSCLRGFIQDFSLDDGVLSIEAEEAWGANLSFSTMARVFKAMNISAYFSMPGIGKVALW